MRVAIVLFTRDLRLHDNPALRAACDEYERIVPLFVLDDAILERFGAPNRVAFLLEALRDLDHSLRAQGGALVVRRGDPVEEVRTCAADVGGQAVFVADDVSAYAHRREQRLCDTGLDVRVFPGLTVIPPGDLTPSGGGDHFAVFTPYWNRWRAAARRALVQAPQRVQLPDLDAGRIPELDEVTAERPSANLPPGGETAGRRRLGAWLESALALYGSRR